MWLSISPGVTARPRRSIRLRARPREPADLLVGADRHDAVAADRHRLRDREALVDRDDLPVGQHQVRLPRRSCCARDAALLRTHDRRDEQRSPSIAPAS